MSGRTSVKRCRLVPTTTSKNHSTCPHWPPPFNATSQCSKQRRRDSSPRRVSESVLLTDSKHQSLDAAVATLEGWTIERVQSAELAGAVASHQGVRAVLVETDDPAQLRAVVERAHGCGIPVIVS